ncbi:hypothetical protein [Methylosinus sp. Sm6]|uniref:hypothetical protein n=1 Tax=Methylosinus sp. Sm6 TaxID=2866948 RepID=UPI001C99BA03|nr:hypothetical protein [Methylosinus sp. Sm6]MBY6242851.1 hypothetical protein [Methylosinus sp. Sm6]
MTLSALAVGALARVVAIALITPLIVEIATGGWAPLSPAGRLVASVAGIALADHAPALRERPPALSDALATYLAAAAMLDDTPERDWRRGLLQPAIDAARQCR